MDFTKAKDYITERLIKELPDDLFYHGAHHTFAVVKATRSYAEKEGVSPDDYYLLLTAAYFHDSGFLFQYGSNEPFAVQLIEKVLPEFDYTAEEISKISSIILATQSDVEPTNLLEKIMCDADHDYIGTEDYHVIAKTLRKELQQRGIEYTDIEWVKLQHNYLTNRHRYYTDTALRERQPQKEKIIRELEEAMQAIEN